MGRGEIKNDDEEIISYFYKPVIVFISQICTRSTEIHPLGHRRLYAWHDARMLSDKKAFNTLSQAIGRVKHYTQENHPENKIKLYCDIDILNYTLGNELENTEKKQLVVAQRVARNVVKDSKFVFEKFEDGYKTIHDVTDWNTNIPENDEIKMKIDTTTYKSVNGKWCNSDRKIRYFNDHRMPGGTTHDQYFNVLQYESSTSNRYIIRRAKFIENPDYSDEVKVEFMTNEKSMYS
jgi:hypothetical protein